MFTRGDHKSVRVRFVPNLLPTRLARDLAKSGEISTKSGGDITKSGDISPNPVKILSNLVDFK